MHILKELYRWRWARQSVGKRNARGRSFRITSLIGLLIVVPFSVVAQTPDNTSLPPDVRLIIDVSGSMKQNDPQNLRQPAVDLLVKLLPEGSKAGVWTFGQWVNMLVPHRDVEGNWREDAAANAKDIKSTGLFTNIGEALEKAAYDIDNPNRNYNTSFILLTDGMVDVSRDNDVNRKEWRRIVDEIIPKYQRAGYTIHTIALSDNADKALMDKLALATDGISAVAKNADDLMKAFLQAFNKAAPAESVPLEGNRFVVDSSVDEFTALIFREGDNLPTELVGPDDKIYKQGEANADANWYHTNTYDLITVKEPLEGEWRVRGDITDESRVTVVSNLRLLVKSLPNNIYRGDILPVSLVLQEDGKTITRAEFLRLLHIEVTGEYLSGNLENENSWKQVLSDGLVPGNGIYNASIPWFDLEGDYRINVLVDGKTFKRQLSHTLSVREAFGVDLKKQADDGQTKYLFTVTSYSRDVDVSKVRVVAKVKAPTGISSIESFTFTEWDNWQLTLTPSDPGRYVVSVRVSGHKANGERFDFTPEPTIFSYPDGSDPFVESEPEPEPEAEPEPEPAKAPPAPELELEPEPEAEPAPEPKSSSNWLLYSLLAAGNLLIIGLAYVAYRVIMGDKKDLAEPDEETDGNEETETPAEKPAKADEPAEPAMEEIPPEAPDEDIIDALAATESDDMDLSTDDVLEANFDLDSNEAEAEAGADADAEEEGDDDDEMPEFSLDDFEPMDLDGLDDDDKDKK